MRSTLRHRFELEVISLKQSKISQASKKGRKKLSRQNGDF